MAMATVTMTALGFRRRSRSTEKEKGESGADDCPRATASWPQKRLPGDSGSREQLPAAGVQRSVCDQSASSAAVGFCIEMRLRHAVVQMRPTIASRVRQQLCVFLIT